MKLFASKMYVTLKYVLLNFFPLSKMYVKIRAYEVVQ